MGSIARMDPKLPSKCRDVSWASPLTPNSKSFFQISIISMIIISMRTSLFVYYY